MAAFIFDLLPAINATLELIEKIMKRQNRKDKLKVSESKLLLNDISQLVAKFSDQADILMLFFAKHQEASYKTRDSDYAELMIANRKLFEISNEMEVIISSISKRFKGIEVEKIKLIEGYCIQIQDFEDIFCLAGARLISIKDNYPNAKDSSLRFDPCFERQIPFVIWQKESDWPRWVQIIGNLGDFNRKSDFDGGISYFNQLLLEISECKKRLSIAIQELS
jgi:hypothetical protein